MTRARETAATVAGVLIGASIASAIAYSIYFREKQVRGRFEPELVLGPEGNPEAIVWFRGPGVEDVELRRFVGEPTSSRGGVLLDAQRWIGEL